MAEFDWDEAMAKIDGSKQATVKLPPPKPVSSTTPDVQSGTTWEWPDDMSEFIPNKDQSKHTTKVNPKRVAKELGAGVVDTVGMLADAIPIMLSGNSALGALINHWMQSRKISSPGEVLGKNYENIVGGFDTPEGTADKYAGSIARNVGRFAVPVAGAETGLARIIAEMGAGGVGAGVAGEAAAENAPDWLDPETARMMGEIAGGLGGAVGAGKAVRSRENTMLIRQGAAHPQYDNILETIVGLEGGGTLEHPNVSPKGAMGVMQVMPDTARKPGFGIRPWDGKSQEDLARVGRQYAAALTGKYGGDEVKVLAAYNAGPGRVDSLVANYGHGWWKHLPDETKKYLQNGLNKLDSVQRGRGVPPMAPEEIAGVMNDPEAASIPSQADELLLSEAATGAGKGRVQEITPPKNEDATTGVLPEDAKGFSFDPTFDEAFAKGSVDDFGAPIEPDLTNVVNLDDFAANKAKARAEQISENKPKDVLTPTERQEMDASVPPDQVPNIDSSHEKFTPYVDTEELVSKAANDVGSGQEPPKQGGGGDGGEGIPPSRPPDDGFEGLDPVEKLLKGIRKAKPVSTEQKKLIHEARQQQAAVLKTIQDQGGSYQDMLKALGGELPGADFESIRHNFTPDDISFLENKVNKSHRLRPFEKVSTLRSLHKLLSDQGLKVPTALELRNLQDVFGSKLVEEMMGRKNMSVSDWLNAPFDITKAVMSSGDISGTTRQGVWFVGRKQFWKSYPVAIRLMLDRYGKGWVTEGKAFDKTMEQIRDMPTYSKMKEAGVKLDDRFLDPNDFFGQTRVAEEMPGKNFFSNFWNQTIGRHVAASDDAFMGALATIRAGVFNDIYLAGKALGKDWDKAALRRLGDYVNTGTGRGGLGKAEQASSWLARYLWSPRLIASRVKLLNPVYYGKTLAQDPFLAKQQARDAASYVTAVSTVLGVAAMAGADIELDPRSSDFAKIKIGNTRIDVTGGFQPYIRLFAQEIAGERKNQRGEIENIGPSPLGLVGLVDNANHQSEFGKDTRLSLFGQFGVNKLGPIPGEVAGFAGQTKYRPFDAATESGKLGAPLWVPDVYQQVKEQGSSGLWVIVPNIIGFGVQDYKPLPPKKEGKKEDDPFAGTGFDDDGGFDKDPFAGTGFGD